MGPTHFWLEKADAAHEATYRELPCCVLRLFNEGVACLCPVRRMEGIWLGTFTAD